MQAHILYPLRKGVGEYLSYDVISGVDVGVNGCAITRYKEAAAHPPPGVLIVLEEMVDVLVRKIVA